MVGGQLARTLPGSATQTSFRVPSNMKIGHVGDGDQINRLDHGRHLSTHEAILNIMKICLIYYKYTSGKNRSAVLCLDTLD